MKIQIAEELNRDTGIRYVLEKLERVWESVSAEKSRILVLDIDGSLGREVYSLMHSGETITVFGGDPCGLMYGIQALTDQMEQYGISGLTDETGGPCLEIRSVDRLIMNRDDESWWMNEDYWEGYIRMLVDSRLNRLCVLTGFDTEYLSPPYPFFVDVPGFENVRTFSERPKEEYVRALNRIGRLCHAYHLSFAFACWQQRPWETGAGKAVEGPSDTESLSEYSRKALPLFLSACSEIDEIQFRVNYESGVGDAVSAEEYWKAQIRAVNLQNEADGKKRRLEIRAKGMTPGMTEYAQSLGLELLVSTKYSCEQMGLPFHMTRLRTQEMGKDLLYNDSRRYSYSDLLKKPMPYKMLYRLWTNGSNTVFLFGDPDYVRRFTDSVKLANGSGFDLIPPLSLKGGREFDKYTGWKLFDDERYAAGGIEDERYFMYYFLFGRIGYRQDLPEYVWKNRLRSRIGNHADKAMKLLEVSGKILPLITTAHFPEHPQLWYWTEMNTGAALFSENNHHSMFLKYKDTYQNSLPCDEGLFCSISAYVGSEGKSDGRYTPLQVSRWLFRLSRTLSDLLEGEEEEDNPDWNGILLDSRMLGGLASFHAEKILAAISLSGYEELGRREELPAALYHMERAREHWITLSGYGKAYHRNLHFDTGTNRYRRGNWSDWIPEIDADIRKLRELLAGTCGKTQDSLAEIPDGNETVREDTGNEGQYRISSKKAVKPGEEILVTVEMENTAAASDVLLRYRHMNHLEGEFRTVRMQGDGRIFTAVIPADYVTREWDILYYASCSSKDGSGIVIPGIINEEYLSPYCKVSVNY